jgi:peptide/nickel transport system ATP-binding protein
VSAEVLRTRALTVGYRRPSGAINTVVLNAELSLYAGAIVGLAGESGCGKSTTALAAIGYRPPGSTILSGESLFEGENLLALPLGRLRSVWGSRIAYLAQNAAGALNPAIRVGRQIEEVLTRHMRLRGSENRRRQIDLLESVALPDPERALRRYAHEFSGGQQQRIAIALALACDPRILIMDEPTTGLDVTTQRQISSLLREIVNRSGAAALYVSHDLALLSGIADALYVMYAGEVVESAPMRELTSAARHPYTRALLGAVPNVRARTRVSGIPGTPPNTVSADSCAYAPRCTLAVARCTLGHVPIEEVGDGHHVRCVRAAEAPRSSVIAAAGDDGEDPRMPSTGEALLTVDHLVCTHGSGAHVVFAVRDVSLAIVPGETVGIVGESGSGKSTLLRALIGLHAPASGAIRFRGEQLAPRAVDRPREVRAEIQLVFQNARSALNPRDTVLETVGRPARLFSDLSRAQTRTLVTGLLDAVKLPSAMLGRYPGELSGGQQQRVAFARALATRPALLLLDEVTSALDVSVQATIIELIRDLPARFGAAVVLVTHDLAVARALCERALVIKDGEVCEAAGVAELFSAPRHPYTRALLSAVPELV